MAGGFQGNRTACVQDQIQCLLCRVVRAIIAAAVSPQKRSAIFLQRFLLQLVCDCSPQRDVAENS